MSPSSLFLYIVSIRLFIFSEFIFYFSEHGNSQLIFMNYELSCVDYLQVSCPQSLACTSIRCECHAHSVGHHPLAKVRWLCQDVPTSLYEVSFKRVRQSSAYDHHWTHPSLFDRMATQFRVHALQLSGPSIACTER